MVKAQVNGPWKPATVSTALEEPRSYIVTFPNGQSLRRNRQHILKCSTPVRISYDLDSTPSHLASTQEPHTNSHEAEKDATETPVSLQPSTRMANVSSTAQPPCREPTRRSTRITSKPDRYTDTWSLLP